MASSPRAAPRLKKFAARNASVPAAQKTKCLPTNPITPTRKPHDAVLKYNCGLDACCPGKSGNLSVHEHTYRRRGEVRISHQQQSVDKKCRRRQKLRGNGNGP